MKTPDEIKRGLEMCYGVMECTDCPYMGKDSAGGDCYDLVKEEALTYIQQLEKDNAQKDERIRKLEREREALIKVAHGQCRACKHKLSFSPFDEPCCKCRNIWPGHGFESRWEWRGVEEENA